MSNTKHPTFTPAPAGWRVVRVSSVESGLMGGDRLITADVEVLPLAGWAIHDAGDGETYEPMYWENDTSIHDGLMLAAVGDTWRHVILGPGEDVPLLDDLNERFRLPEPVLVAPHADPISA